MKNEETGDLSLKPSYKTWGLKMLKYSLLISLLFVGCLFYFFTRPNPRWCKLESTAKVTYNGLASTSRFYSKENGQFLLVVPEENGVTYRIVPHDKRIWWRAKDQELEEIAGRGAWDKNSSANPYGIDLGYVNGKKTASIKTDKDSRLLILLNRIEFNGLEGKPIVVTW